MVHDDDSQRDRRAGQRDASDTCLRKRLHAWGRDAHTAHSPNFRARDVDEFVAIDDDGLPVALIHRPTLRVEMREFYPDGRMESSFEVQRPYHGPSFRGATLTVCWWLEGQHVCSTSQDVSASDGGEQLQVRIDETFAECERGSHVLQFRYDEEVGSYAMDVHAKLELLRPVQPEVSNFYCTGVGVANPELKRMQHTLWANRKGGLSCFHHNPIVPNTPGNMDKMGRRRVPLGGFITYGTEHDTNPALEIVAGHSDAVGFATCSAFYDEHFFAGCPTRIAPDGKYHWAFDYRLVSLPAEFSRALLAQAEPLDLGLDGDPYDSWAYLERIRQANRHVHPLDQALPFALGAVNDFERALDPYEPFVGQYWVFHPQPHGAVSWDRTCGCRSQSSLKLTGRSTAARIVTHGCGPVIRIEPNASYTFSARVKTALTHGARAWLELKPHTYSSADCDKPYESERLSGACDWVECAVVLPRQPDAPHLAAYLHLDGEGEAWFDDVALVRTDT